MLTRRHSSGTRRTTLHSGTLGHAKGLQECQSQGGQHDTSSSVQSNSGCSFFSPQSGAGSSISSPERLSLCPRRRPVIQRDLARADLLQGQHFAHSTTPLSGVDIEVNRASIHMFRRRSAETSCILRKCTFSISTPRIFSVKACNGHCLREQLPRIEGDNVHRQLSLDNGPCQRSGPPGSKTL